MKSLKSAQGRITKHICGLDRRSHHSPLLKALDIDLVQTNVVSLVNSLFYRLGAVESPTRRLCMYTINLYLNGAQIPHGTIVSRVIESGQSPLLSLYCKPNKIRTKNINDGLVDTLHNI